MIETKPEQKQSKFDKYYDKIMDPKWAFWYFVLCMLILILFL